VNPSFSEGRNILFFISEEEAAVLIRHVDGSQLVVVFFQLMVFLHDTMELFGLILKGIFIIDDHFSNLLPDAEGEGLGKLVGEAVVSIFGLRAGGDGIEGEFLVVVIVVLGLLEGNRTDGEGKSGLIHILVAVLMVNRHLVILIIKLNYICSLLG
jgi:hypothetical protein